MDKRMNKSEEYLSGLQAKMVEVEKTNSNFMINPALRKAFKIEAARNETSMSAAIESLLQSYIVKSRQLHGEL